MPISESLIPNSKELLTMVKDPVCGMMIDPKTAAGKSTYQGQTYYFCSLGCKTEFDENPQKFVDKTTTLPHKMS